MRVVVKRSEGTGTNIPGVLRVINDDGKVIKTFQTLERKGYLIPKGVYRLVWEWSPKFRTMLWELKGTPGRTEIKIHAGNKVTDTEGCILIGMYWHNNELRLSKYALEEFNNSLDILSNHKIYIE